MTVEQLLRGALDEATGAFKFTQVAGSISKPGTRPIQYLEDFIDTDSGAAFTSTDDGGTGTNVLLDGQGGWYSVVTAAADNDYHLMSSGTECIKMQAGKPFFFEAKIKLTEANTDDANFIVGLSDTLTTGLLADDGAGPAASYDGAVFFKVDGGTDIQFETSNAGTQVTNAAVSAFSSGTEYTLGISFDPADGVTGNIIPYVNGVASTTHAITLAGLEEMHLIFGVKAGGANAETLSVDYLFLEATR
jgi:hypothetical protein